MTYHLVRKSCPYCKKTISREIYSGAARRLYANPLFECPYCHQVYADKEFGELACEPYKEPDISIRTYIAGNWLAGILSLLLHIVWIVTLVSNGFTKGILVEAGVAMLFTLLVFALPICYYYSRRFETVAAYKTEWEASNKRLSDPQFALKLYLAGYDVPQKFLAPVQDTVDAIQRASDAEKRSMRGQRKLFTGLAATMLRSRRLQNSRVFPKAR